MKAFDHQWQTIKHKHADETHAGEFEGLLEGEREMLDSNPGVGLMKFNFFDPFLGLPLPFGVSTLLLTGPGLDSTSPSINNWASLR